MRYGFVLIIISCCIMLQAQQNSSYNFRHITQSDGLLHTVVKSVVQDSRGFIWILTLNGLQRYDGTRFLNYPFDLNNACRTKDIKNINLYLDSSANNLWLISSEIEKLDLQKNKFTLYTTAQILTDSSFKFDTYTDFSGTKWLAGAFGVFRYNDSEKKMLPYYLHASSLPPNQTLSLNDSVKGELWLADWNGLSLFDKKTLKKYNYSYNPIHHPLLQLLSKNNLTSIFKDSRGNFWIGTGSQKFFRYNSVSQKLSIFFLADIEKKSINQLSEDHVLIVKCFFEDSRHNIWIGTSNGGLLQYNSNSNSFIYLLNDEKRKQGLHYNYEISGIYQDREENIWLSTDNGINIFNPYEQHFQTISHEENNPLSLPKNEIQHFIQAANGDIICGTWGGGITVYDSKWHFKKNIQFAGPYEYNLIWSFVQNDDGTIWIGCQHGYIHIYNPETGLVKTIYPPELQHYTIWCMTKDDSGNIWFGLHNGKIAKWDKKEKKFYPYNDDEKGIGQVFGNVLNIFFDSKQQCWVTTEAGLKRFDTRQRMFSAVYMPNKKTPGTISTYSCGGIEEYNDSTLLIGTKYGGLDFFNPVRKTFTHFTVADGLPANSIHSIKKDSAGFVWFTTDFDLYKFKPGINKFIRYSIEPGIINAEFKTGAFYKLQDGRWVTCTATEVLCFNTSNNSSGIAKSSVQPQITGFKVFNETIETDTFQLAGNQLELNFQQNFLTIEFSMPVFSNQLQTDYYYRLEGIDKDWVDAGSKRFASYTNLDPGKYIFSVKTKNSDAINQSKSLIIIIRPPFWKTWWFIFLGVLIALTLVYRFINWREQQIKDTASTKLKLQLVNAEQYKAKLEMEQIINYFSSSLISKATVDEVLWDVAKNLIGRLGFEDCIIYLWNSDKTKMIQRAGYGPKGSIEEIEKNIFTVSAGQGVVGHVMKTKQPLFIPDTTLDDRYRIDEMQRLSEITVPIIYDDELVGIIDSEHHQKNFFTRQHIQLLSTIATLVANKIKSIESAQSLQLAKIEMLKIDEKLTAAKLEALRSQMNPHFIFNCLNSIDNLIQNSEKEKATLYLSKFAKLIRSVLETSKINTVPCWKDMETLKLYIELEEFRWDKNFVYEINISDEIFRGDYKVPPLVIQPFVENAIHHGLLNKIDPDKKLSITVSASDNHIYYIIKDNGVGRKKAALYKELNRTSHESMGMQLTTDRINLFNQHQNGAVIITDLFNEHDECIGTKVEVTLINQS